MTAIPVIPALPAAPQRGQDPAVFVQRADAFVDALAGFVASVNAFAVAFAQNYANLSTAAFTATSATNVAIGLGVKNFAATAGAAFVGGQTVMIASAADTTKYMQGIVTAYSADTGALTVSVTTFGGAGNRADWRIGLVPAFDIEARLAVMQAGIDATFAALGNMSARTKAAVADLFAWTQDKGLTADLVGGAFAQQALAFAATLVWDWRDGFYRGPVVCPGNVTVGTPANIRAGETRILTLQGSDATARTVAFSSAFKGVLPQITDMTSTKPYRLMIFADTGANLSVTATALA